MLKFCLWFFFFYNRGIDVLLLLLRSFFFYYWNVPLNEYTKDLIQQNGFIYLQIL